MKKKGVLFGNVGPNQNAAGRHVSYCMYESAANKPHQRKPLATIRWQARFCAGKTATGVTRKPTRRPGKRGDATGAGGRRADAIPSGVSPGGVGAGGVGSSAGSSEAVAKALRRDFEATASKRRQAHEQVSVLESQVGGWVCVYVLFEALSRGDDEGGGGGGGAGFGVVCFVLACSLRCICMIPVSYRSVFGVMGLLPCWLA